MLADDPPFQSNGWTILLWSSFRKQWSTLIAEVEELRRADERGYRTHPKARFLALLTKKRQDVPSDPSSKASRQGKTFGTGYTHWHRAKLNDRFRLFFRYRSEEKIIIYAWLNDENTLRQAGGRNDVYATFRAMLERGKPPNNWDELVATCENFPARGEP